jgi:hypothetical protein
VEEALDPPAGPDDEAKAIGFGTFLDRVPQNGIKPLATVADINRLKTIGFQVEAYKHAETDWNSWNDGARTATPNFMKSKPVKWNTSTSWTYSPIEYWPGEKVSFFAYTPSPNSGMTVTFAPAKAANENPQLYYIMSSSYASQMDLIVDAEYNLTGENNSEVKFQFDHVLSRIGFKAKLKNNYAPATVTMTGMSFNYGGLYRTGTYTFNSGTVTGSNKDPGNWDVTGGITTIFSTDLLPYNIRLNSTTPSDIPSGHYLMLIPQKNATNQVYVEVEYTIRFPDDPAIETVNEKVYLQEIIWKPGIAYTYTLIIAALKEMIFDVSEGDDWNVWEDGGNIPIDIPDTP